MKRSDFPDPVDISGRVVVQTAKKTVRGFIFRISENTPAPREECVSRLHSSVPKLPFDRIMELPQFSLLTMLSIVLFGLPEASSWRSNEDRSYGYDLQRGPVFYEAYYPENVGSAASARQLTGIEANAQRRYSNVVQKSGQSLEDPSYVTLGIHHDRDSGQPRDQRSFANDYDRSNQPSRASVLSGDLIDITRESNEPADRIEPQNIALQLKRLIESLRQDTIRRPYSRKNYEENSNVRPDSRSDESINIILSAVRNGALKIPEDEILRLDSQKSSVDSDGRVRFYRPSVKRDFSDLEEKKEAVRSGGFDRTSENRFEGNFGGDEYGDVRGPISELALGRMENIFQPRPQVISYVFSPVRASSVTATNGETTQTRSIRSNERVTRNDGDNITDGGVKDGTSPGIASIEVTEIPRHKIRHHHGEKPRRHRQHRQAAARN